MARMVFLQTYGQYGMGIGYGYKMSLEIILDLINAPSVALERISLFMAQKFGTELASQITAQTAGREWMAEYIFEINDALYNDENQEAVIKAEYKGRLVRCKDCKHYPIGTNRDDLEFPDEVCPCYCEDFWYSWKPNEDFYCGKGERKDE